MKPCKKSCLRVALMLQNYSYQIIFSIFDQQGSTSFRSLAVLFVAYFLFHPKIPTVQYSAVQYSAVQCSTVPCNAVHALCTLFPALEFIENTGCPIKLCPICVVAVQEL